MLNEEIVKQIFFYCDVYGPDALIADEVDICQFADKIVQYVTPMIAQKEHLRCVEIVGNMNKEVGRALLNQRP
jgi:hypothetical protein